MGEITSILKNTFVEEKLSLLQDIVDRTDTYLSNDKPDFLKLYSKHDFEGLLEALKAFRKKNSARLSAISNISSYFLVLDSYILVLACLEKYYEYMLMFFKKRHFDQEKLMRECMAKNDAMEEQLKITAQELSQIVLETSVVQAEIRKRTAESNSIKEKITSINEKIDNNESPLTPQEKQDLIETLEKLNEELHSSDCRLNELKIIRLPHLAESKADAEDAQRFCKLSCDEAKKSLYAARKAVGNRSRLSKEEQEKLTLVCSLGVAKSQEPLAAKEDSESNARLRDTFVSCWENGIVDKIDVIAQNAADQPITYPNPKSSEEELIKIENDLKARLENINNLINILQKSTEWVYASNPSTWGAYFQKLYQLAKA